MIQELSCFQGQAEVAVVVDVDGVMSRTSLRRPMS